MVRPYFGKGLFFNHLYYYVMTDTQNPIDMENVNRIVDRIDLAIDGVPMNFAEFAIAAAIVSNSLAVMALQDSQKEESNGSIN